MSSASKNPTVHILGIPFCDGQPKKGAERGPQALRDNGIAQSISSGYAETKDCGDVEFFEKDPSAFGNIKKSRIVGSGNKQISDAVTKTMRDMDAKDILLTLGGDHSVAIGTIHGHLAAEDDAIVIWVDAHGDINPPPESPSGNIHGMPLAFVTHEVATTVPEGVPGFEWLKPCVRAKDIAFIGLRSVDPPERRVIDDNGITCYDMREVDRLGINEVIKQILEKHNPGLTRPIHLSFDVDALDPCHTPSTGTPETAGLTLREGCFIVESIYKTGKLRCIDLVEVNPSLGTPEDVQMTLDSACYLIATMFGRRGAHGELH